MREANVEDALKVKGRRRARLVRELEKATAELREAVEKADGHVPRLRISQLTGVTRATVYAWLTPKP